MLCVELASFSVSNEADTILMQEHFNHKNEIILWLKELQIDFNLKFKSYYNVEQMLTYYYILLILKNRKDIALYKLRWE